MQFGQLKRREFITLLGGATAWPLTARAQQPGRVYRIAVVSPSASVGDMREGGDNPNYSALFKELRRLGYVEGSNLVVERYSAEGRWERFSDLAGEVVRAKPDLVIVSTSSLVRMFKEATDNIPIVGTMGDPVAFGIVASMARPGGNVTGISVESGLEIWGKRLQILREVLPTAARVGFLLSRPGWDGPAGRAMQAAARQADISLLAPPLESPIHAGEYRRVLEAMAQEHVDGLIVSDAQDNFNFRRVIVRLAEQLRLPTIYPYRAYFDLGGLIVYGSDVAALYRRVANYADQILRGRKPGDLPIDMESKYELLLNLKLAKALGLTMPTSLLVRADEVKNE